MSVTKAQLVQPVGIFTASGVNVSGVLTASSFSGNLTGSAAGLTGTPNLNVGVLTATSFFGSGANLTGIAAAPYVGQSTTSQSPTTTIDLSLGNVVYFTHSVDTTVAFANTSTAQEVRFIRVKDDNATPRTITWPDDFIWDGGSPPVLGISTSAADAQIFNLTTRDTGATWYAYEEFTYQPNAGLFVWGYNNNGQLGQNNTIQYSSPIQIPGTTWSFRAGGYQHSLATKTDGTLWSWGQGGSGQLGQNDRIRRSSPVQIPGTTWSSVVSASVTDGFVLATKTDNTLWAWGAGSSGQLGQNDRISRSSPVQIPGTTWKFITSGSYHTIATKTDNTLWVWGTNNFGQLGQNNIAPFSSPIQIPGNTWSNISAGGNHTVATKTDNTLWVWGYNAYGGLGQNNTTYRSSPVQIPGTTWSSVASAGIHILATKTDETLWAWGYNGQGQLGQNNTTQFSSPVQIPGNTWSSANCGYYYSTATKTDGTLWSWGSNSFGELGQNNITQYSSPVQIPGTSWSSIIGGGIHALAIKELY
jgi:alpha-tubulin suppressor-like RCC1 family protein